MLYSQNVFGVALGAPGGLGHLAALSDAALTALRRLYVQLVPCKCSGEPPAADNSFCPIWLRCDACDEEAYTQAVVEQMTDISRHRRALKHVGDTDVLDGWRKICSRLSKFLEPDCVQLFVDFYCEDPKLSAAFLTPLYQLPPLRHVGIRFQFSPCSGEEEDTSYCIYNQLAQDGIQRLQRNKVAGTFPFLELPIEIQLEILELAGLIQPKQVLFPYRWNPRQSDSCHYQLFRKSFDDHYPIPDPDPDVTEIYADFLCDYPVESIAALFCPSQARSFVSTASSLCACPLQDAAVFRVSKQLSQTCAKVFYSRNTFCCLEGVKNPPELIDFDLNSMLADEDAAARRISRTPRGVSGSSGFRVKAEYDAEGGKITTLDFLRGLPDGALHYLTRLVAIVPAPQRVCERPTSPAWISWLQAIELLGTHSRLDQLTLEVHVTNSERLLYWEKCWSPRLVAETRKDYHRAVAPLAQLRGRLGRLFVYAFVPDPYEIDYRYGEPVLIRQRAAGFARFEKVRGQLEIDLARAVMGQEYDPVAEGKAEKSFFMLNKPADCSLWPNFPY